MFTQQPKASVGASGWCRHWSGRGRRLKALTCQSHVKSTEHLACAVLSCVKPLLSAIKSEHPYTLHSKASSNLFHYQTSKQLFFQSVTFLTSAHHFFIRHRRSETRYFAIFALPTLKPQWQKAHYGKSQGGTLSARASLCFLLRSHHKQTSCRLGSPK